MSHYVVEALHHIGDNSKAVISQFHDIILRFGRRFHKAHTQATTLLLDKRKIGFDTIHGLFCQREAEYGFDSRPKSDIVCRAIARAFRWSMLRGKWIGWDFMPLPDGFVVPERIGLMDLVERVKVVLCANEKIFC